MKLFDLRYMGNIGIAKRRNIGREVGRVSRRTNFGSKVTQTSFRCDLSGVDILE